MELPTTFEAVCELVHKGHQKGAETPPQTVNRLFHENLKWHKNAFAALAPWLSAGNTTLSHEDWPTSDLIPLVWGKRRKPRYEDKPLVIVNYRGADCLIDGNSRVREWHKAGDTGCHAACVLMVLEADTASRDSKKPV